MSLQAVERITRVAVLPHPDRESPEVRRLRPDAETEAHEKNLGYDITSLDPNSGELRLIEIKGLSAASGRILLTPNERRVAEDRRDCYWLYCVTDCHGTPRLAEPIRDPARVAWHPVVKVQHYWLDVDLRHRPLGIAEEQGPLSPADVHADRPTPD